MNEKTQMQISRIVKNIQKLGVKYCAFDFDLTLTSVHLDENNTQDLSALRSMALETLEPKQIDAAITNLNSKNKQEVLEAIGTLKDVLFAHPLDEMKHLIAELKNAGLTVSIFSKNSNRALLDSAASTLNIEYVFQHTDRFSNKIQHIVEQARSIDDSIKPQQCILIDDDEGEGCWLEEAAEKPHFICLVIREEDEDLPEEALEQFSLLGLMQSYLEKTLTKENPFRLFSRNEAPFVSAQQQPEL